MNTFKLPAFGLEIMAEDTARAENRGQWNRGISKELEDQGWRYPTDVEFQMILLPLWTMGVLGLDLTTQTGYMTLKKDPRWNNFSLHLWSLSKGSPSMFFHRVRLVRDL